jgi:hypothetical protein
MITAAPLTFSFAHASVLSASATLQFITSCLLVVSKRALGKQGQQFVRMLTSCFIQQRFMVKFIQEQAEVFVLVLSRQGMHYSNKIHSASDKYAKIQTSLKPFLCVSKRHNLFLPLPPHRTWPVAQ